MPLDIARIILRGISFQNDGRVGCYRPTRLARLCVLIDQTRVRHHCTHDVDEDVGVLFTLDSNVLFVCQQGIA